MTSNAYDLLRKEVAEVPVRIGDKKTSFGFINHNQKYNAEIRKKGEIIYSDKNIFTTEIASALIAKDIFNKKSLENIGAQVLLEEIK